MSKQVTSPDLRIVMAFSKTITDLAQRKVLLYDRSGEEHFNLISALHKSLRESDPDAALYWLGRMLQGGADPRFVVRRMLRMASEDIGMADPRALQQVAAAADIARTRAEDADRLRAAVADPSFRNVFERYVERVRGR